MRITTAAYTEYTGQDREWRFDPVSFGEINLLVGKNGSGKTRLLNVLGGLGRLIAGRTPALFTSGDYRVSLSRQAGSQYTYELSMQARNAVREVLTCGKEEYIRREGSGPGRIRTAPKQDLLDFQIKSTQLAIVAKRDSLQYPYIEEIANWAEAVEHYEFAAFNIGSGKAIGIPGMVATLDQLNNPEKALRRDYEHREILPILLAAALKQYQPDFKDAVLADMKEIGYDLEDIGVGVLSTIPMMAPPLGIIVKEQDLACKTEQTQMSWGMFRALAAVIRMNLAVFATTPSSVFLDDVGEGLDYQRSVALIKILISKARKGHFQLFMSSNDRFVMNEVPLEHWNVVLRTGGAVRIKNHESSRDEFRKFQKLGLNNFDYFVAQTTRK